MSRIERKEQAAAEKKNSRKARFEAKMKAKEEAANTEGTVGKTADKPKATTRFKNWFKGLKTWKKVILIAVVVILVAAIALGATAYWYFSSIFDEVHEETPEDYDLSLTAVDGYYNILLLGVDTRDMDDLEGTRSDAMMVISINEETSDVKILSIYRDTYLKLGNTSTYDKITHACVYGGPEMTMASLNQALDLNISNYVVVNFKAVADLVDAVGGIEVDVQDYEIQQLNKYTKETANNIGRKEYQLVKSAGVQTLDGCQAVSYSRIRKGVGDDFKRTERMRTVVSLTMDKMKTMSFGDLKDIIKMMTPQVQTNLSKNNILGLAIRLPQYNIIGTTGWPYNVFTGSINERSYVFPSNLASNVVKLHQEFFGQEDYSPSAKVNSISAEIIRRVEEARQKAELENEQEVDTALPIDPTDPNAPTIPEDGEGGENTGDTIGGEGNGDTGNDGTGDTTGGEGNGDTGNDETGDTTGGEGDGSDTGGNEDGSGDTGTGEGAAA